MTKFKYSAVPEVGTKNSVADPRIPTDLKELEEWLNGKNIETTDNLKKEGIAEESLSKPLQEKISATLSGFTFKETSASKEVAANEFLLGTKTAITITLPAPTANRQVAMGCSGAATSIKVTASSGNIYGDFVSGVATVELTTYQHLVLLGSGSNWLIIAGEPKREQKYEVKTYTKAEIEAGVELSATRDALAAFKTGIGNLSAWTIGGVPAPVSGQFRVPAGQKFKATSETATSELYVLLL